MATILEEMMLKLGLDASGAEKGAKEAGAAMEHLGHAMHAIEGALSFEKIKDTFRDLVGESSAAEAAQRKFEGAMRASGTAANPGEFFELAESLSKVTTFSKDATVEAGAMLGRFGLGQKNITSLLPQLQDLSAFMGTDLVSSADMMGRAIETGGEGLKALGLGFSASEKEAFRLASTQERVAMVSAKLSSYHGQAAAMAKTAAGAQMVLDHSMGELRVQLGRIIETPIAGALNAMSGAVQHATEWFKGLSQPARDIVSALAMTVGAAAGAASGAIALAGAYGVFKSLKIAETLADAGKGMLRLGTSALSALPGIASAMASLVAPALIVVAVIAAIGVALLALKTAWDNNTGGMRDSFMEMAASIDKAWTSVVESVSGLWNSTLESMDSNIASWTQGIAKWWDSLVGGLRKAWESFSSFFSEKALTIYGMISGMSPEETHAMVAESNKTSGGIFNPSAAVDAVTKSAGEWKAKALEVAKGGSKFIGQMGDEAVDALAKIKELGGPLADKIMSVLGSLMPGFLQGMGGKADEEHAKIQGVQSKGEIYDLKQLLSGSPLGFNKATEADVGGKIQGEFATTNSDGGKEAAAFFRNIQQMTGASTEALSGVIMSLANAKVDAKKIPDIIGMMVAAQNEAGVTLQDGGAKLISDLVQMGFTADQIPDQMQKALNDLKTAQQAANQAAASMQASGAVQAGAERTKSALEMFAGAALSSMGKHGQAIASAVEQYMATKNVFAAMLPIIIDILGGTVSFNTIVKLLASIFNRFSNDLSPVIYFVVVLMQVLNKLVAALHPVHWLVGQLAIKFGNLLTVIANFFGQKLQPINNDAEAFGAGLQGAKSNLDILNQSLGDSAQNIPEGFKVANARYNALAATGADGLTTATGPAVTTGTGDSGPLSADNKSAMANFMQSGFMKVIEAVGNALKDAAYDVFVQPFVAWKVLILQVADGLKILGAGIANTVSFIGAKASGFLANAQLNMDSFINNFNGGINFLVSWFKALPTNIWNLLQQLPAQIEAAIKSVLKAIPGNPLHINDALITKTGQVIQMHPDDNLYAFKSTPSLPGMSSGASGDGGGGMTTHINSPVINISTAATDPAAVAKAVSQAMQDLAYRRSGTKWQPNTRVQYGS